MKWFLKMFAWSAQDGDDSTLMSGVRAKRLGNARGIATMLLVVFVFFNAIPGTTTIKEGCFYLAFLIFTGVVLLFRDKIDLKSPVTVTLFVYSLWAAASVFWTLDRENTVHHLVWHLLKGLVLCGLIVHFVKTKKEITLVGLAVVLSSLVISFLLLYKHFVISGAGFDNKLGTYFPELAVNWIAYTVVFSMVIVLGFCQKESGWACIFLALPFLSIFCLVLYLTQSRATVLAMFSAVMLMSLVTSRKIVFLLTAVILAIIFLGPVEKRFGVSDVFSGVRTAVNYTSYEIMKDYPYGVGYGAEIYGTRLDLKKYNARVPAKFKKHNRILKDPHSLLFGVGVRLGFVGVVLFAGVVLSFLGMCMRMIRQQRDPFVRKWGGSVLAGFVGFMVVAVVEPASSHYVDNVFFIILAMGISLYRMQNRSGDA